MSDPTKDDVSLLSPEYDALFAKAVEGFVARMRENQLISMKSIASSIPPSEIPKRRDRTSSFMDKHPTLGKLKSI
ncbi:MAG: hypothetical protein IPI95_02705 [Flavobacteriales bacterium]|nr:hypothetical protein [Flavobacteriales bacterium]